MAKTRNTSQTEKLLLFQDTDAGNAEAFELLHGNWFRFDRTKGKWLMWDGCYWAEDVTGEVERAALITVRTRLQAALSMADKDERDDRMNWALKSESVWGREALLKSARSLMGFATITEQYDRDAFLLTVANGTVDLRTGRLRSVRPEDLITRASASRYELGAQAPRWQQFLAEVFAGDEELIGYVQRAVGYSLTGDTREQCFFILIGGGANGKSTFIEIVCKLLGTHAVTAEFSTFLARKNLGAPRNDIARLYAARLVKAAEAEHQAPLAEAVIKEVTGEDTIAARFLYHEHFTFKPRFKIWLVTNHKPDIRGTDPAIWRRVRLISFTQQFEGAARDPNLRRKLEAELPGILNWAIDGCLQWQRHGLGEAPRVTRATLEYRQESDQIGRFVRECCVLGRNASAPAQKLYETYIAWCGERREKSDANNVFARSLAGRGITKGRSRSGVIYKGVGLAPSAAAAAAGMLAPAERTDQ